MSSKKKQTITLQRSATPVALPFVYYDQHRPWKNPAYVPKKRITVKQLVNDEMALKRDGPVPPNLTPEQMDALPPKPNYMALQPPPTLKPKKKYCDITGLIAPYTDPRTKLHYHSAEIYAYIKTLSPEAIDTILAVRNAHARLK